MPRIWSLASFEEFPLKNPVDNYSSRLIKTPTPQHPTVFPQPAPLPAVVILVEELPSNDAPAP
jgi:hypothetical protein